MRRRKISLILILAFISLAPGLAVAQEPVKEAAGQIQAPARIDLDVKDVDIRDIAGMLSRISGLNVVVSDDVMAKVTLRATQVDWETVLAMILKTYNLTSLREGNFLRIMTFQKLQQEEQGVPLVTKVIFLNFAKAGDISGALSSLGSGRGRISTDTTTNSLIITETPDNIEKMLAVIQELDKRTPQVMIEAMMLDVKLTNEDQLGINWTLSDKASERAIGTSGEISLTQTLKSAAAAGIIRYGKTLLPKANFIAYIDFMVRNSKAEILANPKVLTLDGRTANIELTDEIPYLSSSIASTGGAVTTSASFRQAGIKLNVTPLISAGGYIFLTIKTEQSFQSSTITTTAGAQPVIDSRKAETNLLVADGETIVIGGLRKKDTTKTVDKLPILGAIPFLGKLFQTNVNKVVNTELLIFVTPYIVSESRLTLREEKNLKKFDAIRDKRKKAMPSAEPPFQLRPPK